MSDVNIAGLNLQTEILGSKVNVSNLNLQTEIQASKVKIAGVNLQVEVVLSYIPPLTSRYGLIKILNSALEREAVIKNAVKATRTEEINGENTLDFEAILDDKLNALIDEDSILELEDDYFDLMFFDKNSNEDGTNMVKVEAEHISYRLNNPEYNVEYFTEIGTPTYILGKILEGTDFTVGTVEYIAETTYSAQEPKSRRQLLMEFIAILEGEVAFDKFAVNITTHRGSTALKPILKDRNVKIISKVLNKRELDDFGNPTVSYTCEPVVLPTDTYALGDDIILLQKSLGIAEPLRVVRISYNPYDPMDATIVFSNYINGLENEIFRIITTTVVKDKLYNGIRIGPEYGFEAIRNDKKARAYFRSDGMVFQKGDGTGDENSWEETLSIDIDGNLILHGALSWDDITEQPFIPEGFTFEAWRLAAITATYIDEDGVWTPNVYATNINVVNGQIADAQIGDLSADKITAGTISLTDSISIESDDSSVIIDENGIAITGGKISIENKAGTGSIIDEYGIDPRFLDYFKNLVYNSSFEIFDVVNNENVPRYWTGGLSDANSNFHGNYSLKLTHGQDTIQTVSAGINPNWYGRERTRVAFYRKLGQLAIEIKDETNGTYFTLTDEAGNTGTTITLAAHPNWQSSRASVSFDPSEAGHASCVLYRISFTNVHASEACYIDAVQCHPDFTGKWPQLYKDGPKSVGVNGSIQEIYVGATAPADTTILWYDIS